MAFLDFDTDYFLTDSSPRPTSVVFELDHNVFIGAFRFELADTGQLAQKNAALWFARNFKSPRLLLTVPHGSMGENEFFTSLFASPMSGSTEYNSKISTLLGSHYEAWAALFNNPRIEDPAELLGTYWKSPLRIFSDDFAKVFAKADISLDVITDALARGFGITTSYPTLRNHLRQLGYLVDPSFTLSKNAILASMATAAHEPILQKDADQFELFLETFKTNDWHLTSDVLEDYLENAAIYMGKVFIQFDVGNDRSKVFRNIERCIERWGLGGMIDVERVARIRESITAEYEKGPNFGDTRKAPNGAHEHAWSDFQEDRFFHLDTWLKGRAPIRSRDADAWHSMPLQ